MKLFLRKSLTFSERDKQEGKLVEPKRLIF